MQNSEQVSLSQNSFSPWFGRLEDLLILFIERKSKLKFEECFLEMWKSDNMTKESFRILKEIPCMTTTTLPKAQDKQLQPMNGFCGLTISIWMKKSPKISCLKKLLSKLMTLCDTQRSWQLVSAMKSLFSSVDPLELENPATLRIISWMNFLPLSICQ